MLKDRINQDLKQALLAGDKVLATTLRGLKSTILYAEVAKGERDSGLADDEIIMLLAKEAKKRQESADLFAQGGNHEKSQAELTEKAVIEQYLPKQLTDEELSSIVDQVIKDLNPTGPQAMGQVIGQVKQEAGAGADGSRIASLVKERLQSK